MAVRIESSGGRPTASRPGTLASLRPLGPYLRRYRGTLALGLLILLATNVATLLGPWVLKLAVDDLALGPAPGLFAAYFGLIVSVAVVAGCLRYLMRRTLVGLSREIELDLRNDLFACLTRLDEDWFSRMPTGDLMNRLVNDLSAVRMVLGPGIMNLANTAAIFVAVSAFLCALDWRLALLALAPMPLLSAAESVLGTRLHDRHTAAQEELSALSSLTQESLAGVRVVRSYDQEANQIQAFDRRALALLEKGLAVSRIGAVFHPLMSLLAGTSLVLVLLFGGRAVIAGTLSIGTFVAFQSYLALLVWPMIALGWVFNLFERGASSMRRLSDILLAVPRVRESASPRQRTGSPGEIEAREVSFRYPGSRALALDRVSFRVPAGGSLGIVGATGSGKSTLVSLLVRRHDASSGVMLLDGIPVHELALADLRRAIAFVPQETVLFSDTIRANIAFAPEALQDPRVEEAAARASLHEEVRAFPHGYETRVGERGVTLSGGQRQRVAIARVLLLEPAVLVLDDALSAVDAECESRLLAEFQRSARGVTRIVVSHRISAVRDADEILVLAEGQVRERGRHLELIAAGGLYAAIERRQRLEQELESA